MKKEKDDENTYGGRTKCKICEFFLHFFLFVKTLHIYLFFFRLKHESRLVDLELLKARQETARLRRILVEKSREVELLRQRVAARREKQRKKGNKKEDPKTK